MPFLNGVFTLSNAAFVTNTIISSSVANGNNSDFSTGLSTCVLKDGTQATTALVPFAFGISVGNTGTNILGKFSKRVSAEVTTTSTALVALSAFTFPIGANEEWQAEYFTDFSDSTQAGIYVGVSTPVGATQNIVAYGIRTQSTLLSVICSQTVSSGIQLPMTAAGLGTELFSSVSLWVLNGANAGNVAFQYSMATATATGLSARKGSHMYATRLA
jgi:hypothetical protein